RPRTPPFQGGGTGSNPVGGADRPCPRFQVARSPWCARRGRSTHSRPALPPCCVSRAFLAVDTAGLLLFGDQNLRPNRRGTGDAPSLHGRRVRSEQVDAALG